MKKKFAFVLAAVLLLTPLSCAFARSAEEEAMVQHMVKIVNEFREEKGLPPYKVSPHMEVFAQDWAEKMQRRDILEHRSHEDFKNFMGKNNMTIGENVAYYFGNKDGIEAMDDILQGWMQSPGHYRNMTRADDTHFGIGISKVGKSVYATLNMGGYFSDVKEEDNPVPVPGEGEKGVPGLNYSAVPFADESRHRAVVGPGYIVEASGYALNGATKVRVTTVPGTNKRNVELEKDGERVHTRGLVYVYMKVPEGTPRPFRVKVDGKWTNFEFVPGTAYVQFATVL